MQLSVEMGPSFSKITNEYIYLTYLSLVFIGIYFQKLFNIPGFAFVQSREIEKKHLSSHPVDIQKYVDR